QSHAACVDGEALPEIGDRHRRALDVPSGIALAPGAVEAHDPPGPGRLPEDEVGRVALVVVDSLEPVAGPELVERVARQAPVAGEGRDVVVDGAAVDVGVTRSRSRPMRSITWPMCPEAFG